MNRRGFLRGLATALLAGTAQVYGLLPASFTQYPAGIFNPEKVYWQNMARLVAYGFEVPANTPSFSKHDLDGIEAVLKEMYATTTSEYPEAPAHQPRI